MFNPGETIVHTFYIPFKRNDVTKVIVSYKDCKDVFYIKEITSDKIIEASEDETVVIADMGQEETLMFKERSNYKIQLNVIAGTSRFASKEMEGSTGPQHVKEVIQV
jgi:hypothetical protein